MRPARLHISSRMRRRGLLDVTAGFSRRSGCASAVRLDLASQAEPRVSALREHEVCETVVDGGPRREHAVAVGVAP